MTYSEVTKLRHGVIVAYISNGEGRVFSAETVELWRKSPKKGNLKRADVGVTNDAGIVVFNVRRSGDYYVEVPVLNLHSDVISTRLRKKSKRRKKKS